MKTIIINREEFKISAAFERVIDHVAKRGFGITSDFDEGSRARYRTNVVGSCRTIEQLEAATAGAVTKQYGPGPAAAEKAHPRARSFIVPTSARRLNLVVRKLRAPDFQTSDHKGETRC